MAIDIQGLTRLAFAIAADQAPDALPTCTVRLGPTPDIDPVTDQQTTTWDVEVAGIRPVAYQSESEQKKSDDPEANLKSFAFQAADFPDGAQLDQKGEVLEGSTLWRVYRVDIDPSGSLAIMHSRR